MSKEEITKHIKTHYSNLLQKILILKVEYKANYTFEYDGTRTKLTHKRGTYKIETV
jgi:hypothetical protein